MEFLSKTERQLCVGIGQVGYQNPFLPQRIELEKQLLGADFVAGEPVWSYKHNRRAETSNLERISSLAEQLVETLRGRLAEGVKASRQDLELYIEAALYHLFDQFRYDFHELIENAHAGKPHTSVKFWKRFTARHAELLQPAGKPLLPAEESQHLDAAHLLACLFQVRRAFFHVFFFIAGGSPSAARLRAAIWQSIFTHDLRRYQRILFRHMDDVTTLITGPSGTGKELVARAIGLSRYIAFDPTKSQFRDSFVNVFQAVNLSALSPTLIESELFGHRRGSFTGAVADRVGWLATCGPHGAVFLDEIGELAPEIQVKLLRLLQSRKFQRLGDTDELTFSGKILAATNRDLVHEMQCGQFREDFYYRLCADRIETPALRQQLDEHPADLEMLLLFIARRVVPEEAEQLAAEANAWITNNLGTAYPWPGNFRELEQCFRNFMIHGEYRPAQFAEDCAEMPITQLLSASSAKQLSAEQLIQRYCKHVYDICGSYEQTAQQVQLDRRTVKRKITECEED